MQKETGRGESEFGRIIGSGLGGNVIKLDCYTRAGSHVPGDVVFIGSAYNPLTAKELRRIAYFMERKCKWPKN